MVTTRRASVGNSALGAVSLVVVIGVAIVVGALLAGYRPVVIQTGSMGQTAPPGSLVVAMPRDGAAIAVDDIVVMRRPGSTPVTHRVIEIEQEGSARFAITQGDANEAPDAAPYPLDGEELVARWIAPAWGKRLETVFQPGIALAVFAFAVVVFAAQILRRIWAPTTPRPNHARPSTSTTVGRAHDPHSRRRGRRVVAVAALPLAGMMTMGVAWAMFQSSESVAANSFGAAECFDPQLRSVQNGETVHAVNGAVNVPITAVDPSDSFVVASVRSNANEPVDSAVQVRLTGGGTALELDRATDAGAPPLVAVAWSVVEYECGISVQRGTINGAGTVTVDVPISSADVASSFVLASSAAEATATEFDGDDLFAAELTTDTNLRISSGGDIFDPQRSFAWQVVTFDDGGDIGVQRVTASLTAGTGSTTVSLATPVDPETTFLLASATSTSAGPDIGERLFRAHLVDATTIAIDRSVTTSGLDVHIQVVTLQDGSTVRHGTVDFSPGQPARTVDIEPVDPSRSTALATVQVAGLAAGGMTDFVANDVVGEATATFTVSDPTTVSVRRDPSASSASFGWQVIEWAGPEWWNNQYTFRQRIDVDTTSAAAPGGYTVPLTLDHAALVSSNLARADGDDMRVMRWDGASWSELDRILDDGSAWNQVTTTLLFRTVDPIATNAVATYWLYFGHDTPPVPADDPEAVFLLTEDFETGDLGDFEDRTAGTNWYQADPWTRRIQITVAAGRVSEDLIDFPLPLEITAADLGANALADGSDIRFTASDGSTPLAHEIERWDQGSGTLVAWVRIPVLSAASATTVHLYYGAPNAPTQHDVRATWAPGIEAAWHGANDPAGSGPQLDDSTVANHDGISRGAMTTSDLVAGVVGSGLDLDGIDDHLQADSFDLGSAQLTMSGWVRPDGSGVADGRLLAKAKSTVDTLFELVVTPAGAARARLSLDGALVSAQSADGLVGTGSWHHVAAVWDGIDLTLHVDANPAGSTSATGSLDADASMPVTIGNVAGGGGAVGGTIDEIRVETLARSVGWLAAVEASHRSPATFAVVAAPESGIWLSQGAWTARKPVSIDPSVTAAGLTQIAVPIQFADMQVAASARPDGSDIVFTAADGTTRIDHVLEGYDSGSGAVVAWVRVPALSTTTATDLFMYYGNGMASDQGDPEAVFGTEADLALLGS